MNKSKLIELRNLAEAIERLLEVDYKHVSEDFDVGVFTSVKRMNNFIEFELEKIGSCE